MHNFRFDKLVNRARTQDKIGKDMATDKAKGMIDMLVQRRKFLKVRRKTRNTLRRDKSSIMLVGNWLKPVADQTSEIFHAPSRTRSLSKVRRENGN